LNLLVGPRDAGPVLVHTYDGRTDIVKAGVNPLLHYLATGRFENHKASETFDPAAYLEANPEVANSGIEPFLHYALIGRAAGAPRSRAEVTCRKLGLDYEATTRAAGLSQGDLEAILLSGIFDQDYYLKTYPDIAQAGVNQAAAHPHYRCADTND
jgi:hypothetical protein